MSPINVEERAAQSKGSSSDAIYRMVRRVIQQHHSSKGRLVDFGCGGGHVWPYVNDLFDAYEGVDVVRYDQFPDEATFHKLDLDSGRSPLPDHYADVVVGIETIEHLENPRAFVRELVRICKKGGWVMVTTPNQLSLLSKLTLLLTNQFNAFTNTNYPAHITALLEIDLRRIFHENGLEDCTVHYSLKGRIPKGNLHWPRSVTGAFPRALSDNLSILGRRT